MSLSDKRQPIIANYGDVSKVVAYDYTEEDVKEFIKELKEVLTPQLFHEIYEKQARKSGWETHKDCKLKPFDELPETNQETMIYTLNEIHKRIDKLAGEKLIWV